jgi:fatty-acyl-CoA synthase
VRTPLTIDDHLRRAEQVYPDRVAFVDEPDQPATSLGTCTYRELGDRARAQAAGLDALGLEVGDRVAIVSQNAGRLLGSFFGVSAWGRVLVPVNFRLGPDEIAYIVEHSGARVLLLDPELEEVCAPIEVEHRFVLGRDDDRLYHWGVAPRPWEDRDEDATATINYTSGTTARPKGVQMTHRNLWLNAATFGWHTGVSDRDVYLHTLPMFHANGWGMPFAVTAMGVPQIVLRKVDGHEILRRVDEHGVTLLCGAPASPPSASTWPSTTRAKSWRGATTSSPGTGSSRRHRPRRCGTAGSTPATAA